MNKVDYLKKMEEVLSDESKFKREPNLKDNTPSVEKKITKELMLLLKEGIIDINTAVSFFSYKLFEESAHWMYKIYSKLII